MTIPVTAVSTVSCPVWGMPICPPCPPRVTLLATVTPVSAPAGITAWSREAEIVRR
jgi:hypothetical protein